MALEALKQYASQNEAITPKKPELTPEQNRVKKQAENVRVSELLRIKISKDIAQGTDEHLILLDALKCISLMTGDIAFYEANSKQLGEG